MLTITCDLHDGTWHIPPSTHYIEIRAVSNGPEPSMYWRHACLLCWWDFLRVWAQDAERYKEVEIRRQITSPPLGWLPE